MTRDGCARFGAAPAVDTEDTGPDGLRTRAVAWFTGYRCIEYKLSTE
jgi:hypothetical protein